MSNFITVIIMPISEVSSLVCYGLVFCLRRENTILPDILDAVECYQNQGGEGFILTGINKNVKGSTIMISRRRENTVTSSNFGNLITGRCVFVLVKF